MKVDNFFKQEELEACREEIKSLVEDLAQRLYKAGKIKSENLSNALLYSTKIMTETFKLSLRNGLVVERFSSHAYVPLHATCSPTCPVEAIIFQEKSMGFPSSNNRQVFL